MKFNLDPWRQSAKDRLVELCDSGVFQVTPMSTFSRATYAQDATPDISAPKKVKNSEELYREYEKEKWADELSRIVSTDSLFVGDIYSVFHPSDKVKLIRVFDQLYLANEVNIRKFFIECLAELLYPHLVGSSALIDIGAGTGATSIPLIYQIPDLKLPYYATDLSPSGLAALEKVAQNFDIDVCTSVNDFADGFHPSFNPPKGSCILTTFSLSCLPLISQDFFKDIESLEPNFVFHIESVFENLDETNSLDRHAIEYVYLNGYNTNLLTVLGHHLETSQSYEIKFVSPIFLGENPAFPLTIVCWGKVSL
jgi:hypothetical protein